MRPLPLLAAGLLMLATAFYIVSMASSSWLISTQQNSQHFVGPYRTCYRTNDGIETCSHIGNDCAAEISSSSGAPPFASSCHLLRTVRAFLIFALIFSALGLLSAYLASFEKVLMLVPRTHTIVWGALSGIFGLVAWATWLAISNESSMGTYSYGFAFGLATAAWVTPLIAACLIAIPFPLSWRQELALTRQQWTQSSEASSGGAGGGVGAASGASAEEAEEMQAAPQETMLDKALVSVGLGAWTQRARAERRSGAADSRGGHRGGAMRTGGGVGLHSSGHGVHTGHAGGRTGLTGPMASSGQSGPSSSSTATGLGSSLYGTAPTGPSSSETGGMTGSSTTATTGGGTASNRPRLGESMA